MLSFSRNKQLSVIIFFSNKFLFFYIFSHNKQWSIFLNIMRIFLIILSQYKNYIDETSSSWLSSCFSSCILSNESSIIASSSPLINNSLSVPLFLSLKHSWSLIFYFSQICSFTLHLIFLTIVSHLICRIRERERERGRGRILMSKTASARFCRCSNKKSIVPTGSWLIWLILENDYKENLSRKMFDFYGRKYNNKKSLGIYWFNDKSFTNKP